MGEDPEAGLAALNGRVEVVVVRDGLMKGAEWEPRPLGEGAVGWERLLRRLHERAFSGALCLDLRGRTPKEGLKDATALVYLLRGARR